MNKKEIQSKVSKATKELKSQLLDGEYYSQSPATKCVVAYPSGLIAVQDSAPGISWDNDCLTIFEVDTSDLDNYIDEHIEDIKNTRERIRITKNIIDNLVTEADGSGLGIDAIKEYLDNPYDKEEEVE